MLSCVNLLDFLIYYTLVQMLSWLYFNTIYCYLFKINSIYGNYSPLLLCLVIGCLQLDFSILLFLKEFKKLDILMKFSVRI